MELRMLMSDTAIIPKVKLEKIEYIYMKRSKEDAEKVINEIAKEVIDMHMELMIKRLKEDADDHTDNQIE